MSSAVWHPFTQHGLGEEYPEIARAKGIWLHGADGRKWIDAISSWWVTTHGHGHPRIVSAIREQAERLDQIIFAGWTHAPAEAVARELVRIMPAPLSRVFFSDSGSTSVEVALKMALGHFLNRGEHRDRIIVMEHSYHGDTVGAMSVGARGVFNRAYAPLLFDVDTIPYPSEGREQETLDALEHYCRVHDAAALIVEPLILGAGGMLTYSPTVLSEMRNICARHGVLFIADEVMTGWGRTGTLLACEQANIVPDILCLSKGLTGGAVPLAVTMATEEIFRSHFSPDRERMFFHSSSYTANPIACAAADANLAIWREEPVRDRIDALGQAQQHCLGEMAGRADVRNARRMGTIAAFDIVAGDDGYMSNIAPALSARCREMGVLLRPLGNSVYIMPPYCISEAGLQKVYETIRIALHDIAIDGAD